MGLGEQQEPILHLTLNDGEGIVINDSSKFNNNGAWGGGAVSGVGSDLDVQDCLFRGNRANIGVVRIHRCVGIASTIIVMYPCIVFIFLA